jgi:hypothetical protein
MPEDGLKCSPSLFPKLPLFLTVTMSLYLSYMGEWPSLTWKPRSLGLGSKTQVSEFLGLQLQIFKAILAFTRGRGHGWDCPTSLGQEIRCAQSQDTVTFRTQEGDHDHAGLLPHCLPQCPLPAPMPGNCRKALGISSKTSLPAHVCACGLFRFPPF